MKKTKTLARALRRPWRLLILLAHVLIGVIAAYTFLGGSRETAPRSAKQRAIVRWWMRRVCRVLGMHVKRYGPPPEPGTLLVANHVSWLDIPACMSVMDINFVSKHDVLEWPFVGTMAKRAGTIFIVRGGREAATTTADHMAARLMQPSNILIFPEATTTDGLNVHRFHARLYQAAVQTKAPIQALAIRYPGHDGPEGIAPFIGDQTMFGHLWRLLGEKRFSVELHFCDPVSSNADRRTLADRTREQICHVLQRQ